MSIYRDIGTMRSTSRPNQVFDFVARGDLQDGQSATITTDPLGLHTAYFAKTDAGFWISTRLDWLAGELGLSEPDAATLGSRWLGFSQMSYESGVSGISRLGPGGYLKTDGSSIHASSMSWSPGDGKTDVAELAALLEASCNPDPRPDGGAMNLALSGGVDSRLILSLVSPDLNIAAHVFGEDQEPDVAIAKELAAQRGIEIAVYDTSIFPPPSECIEILKELAGVSAGFVSVSDLIEKRHYRRIGDGGGILHGLGGELYRRQFLNRFLASGGRSDILRQNWSAAAESIVADPGPEFRKDAARTMVVGARERLIAAFDAMPDPRQMGPANWADLLMARYRIPGAHMAHQCLVDHFGWGFSPFEQPDCLDAMFRLPVTDRTGGRAIKQLIRQRSRDLWHTPFVTNDTLYPGWLPSSMANIWTRLRRKQNFLKRRRDRLLLHLEQPIRDLASDQSTKADSIFDHDQIRRSVSGYYDGDSAAAGTIEKWFSYRMWRHGLRHPTK